MARLAVDSVGIPNQGMEDGQTASERAEIVRRLDTDDDALRSTAACFAGGAGTETGEHLTWRLRRQRGPWIASHWGE